MVSDIGRTCLRDNGYKSRCEKFGLMRLVDLLWLWNFSNEGITLLRMEYHNNVWKKMYGRRSM